MTQSSRIGRTEVSATISASCSGIPQHIWLFERLFERICPAAIHQSRDLQMKARNSKHARCLKVSVPLWCIAIAVHRAMRQLHSRRVEHITLGVPWVI